MLLRDTPNDDPLLAESKNARLVTIVKRAQARDREAFAYCSSPHSLASLPFPLATAPYLEERGQN